MPAAPARVPPAANQSTRPAPPRRPAPPVQPPPEPDLFEEAEIVDDEPIVARRDATPKKSKKKKQSIPMPVVLGSAVGTGAILIGVVLWLILRPTSGGHAAKQPATPPVTAKVNQPPAPPPSAPDLVTHELQHHGFAIGLRANWKAIDLAKIDEEIKALEAQNPQVAATVGPSLRTVAQFGGKLIGLDLQSIAGGLATNVNVVKQQLPQPISLDAYVQMNLQQLEVLPAAVKPIQHERVRLTAGDAERLRYALNMPTPTGQVTASLVQYILVKDNSAFVITLTAANDQLVRFTPLFDKVVQSFRILN